MELYLERGFDQTTVAEIANRAGLTERTFFRHFADKKEVLFAGGVELRDRLVQAVAEAPESDTPMEAVARALECLPEIFQPLRDQVRLRQKVINANPELQERELIKMAGLAEAVADALRRRGVGHPAARLAAEAGITVFRVAFQRWVETPKQADLSQLLHASLKDLREVVAPS